MAATGTTRSIDTMMLPTQLLLRVIEQWGTEPASALHGTGLKSADLEDDDTWISYRQTMRIVDNSYKLTERDTLGLDVGSAEDISTFGILGYAMLSCATVGNALAVGEKYQRTAQNVCDVQIKMDDEHCTISAATPFVLKPSGYRFTIEELFSGVMELIRSLSGEELYPDEAAVADALAVSGRTMRRRLSALGTSYREVLDQVRSDLAQQYLQNSSLKVEQVGELLGYTETTNFRRAFKRWLGMS